MKTVPAGVFKTKCLALMDQVEHTREPILITKRGRPVARLEPIEVETNNLFGFMKGKGEVIGDIVNPVFDSDEWDFLK